MKCQSQGSSAAAKGAFYRHLSSGEWRRPLSRRAIRTAYSERPEARGRKLIEVPGYTFHVLVTTLTHAPVQTWQFYNSRADSENRLKELKEDFGADGFCSAVLQWH
jgi:hypothetical protein